MLLMQGKMVVKSTFACSIQIIEDISEWTTSKIPRALFYFIFMALRVISFSRLVDLPLTESLSSLFKFVFKYTMHQLHVDIISILSCRFLPWGDYVDTTLRAFAVCGMRPTSNSKTQITKSPPTHSGTTLLVLFYDANATWAYCA